MKLAICIICVTSFAVEHGARANCDKAPARAATLDVYECTPVNNADGIGVVVRGTVSWTKGSSEDNLHLWIPGTEGLDCETLIGPSRVAASVEKVCCEPSTGAMCEIGADAVVSKAKLVPPTPVKKATRAQLETEIEKLRAQNARLRADNFKMRGQLQAENERLRQESKKLRTNLK